MLCVPAKSEAALAGGSVGPFHPDGLSEFQREAGLRAADDDRTF
jgi:hypothetical protein